MLCRIVPLRRKKKDGLVPVYLNVYDLTPFNGYAYWVGLGVYHSGVQVHGVEYGFGAHERATTGIFEVEPKHCPGFTFRKSILVGRTDLGSKEVRAFMEKLAAEYSGTSYHLITKNCNHFCNDVCLKLTGRSIPRWVNRLARLGVLCKCVLPAGLNETRVGHIKRVSEEEKKKKMKKLSSQSSRFASPCSSSSSSNPPPASIQPSRSLGSGLKSNSRQKQCSSPSLLLINTSTPTNTSLKL